jgi:outer membrane protein
MRSIVRFLLCFALACFAASAVSQALDNPILGRADALLREGKAQEAWDLLAPLEARHAGEPDFDYLLAVSALESGRPDRATFVLERVLALNPGHVAARLEMARAYFSLRDFERAEREFNVVLRGDPSAETRALVQSYKARMPAAAATPGGRLSGYVEAGFGRDTNVPAATAQSSIFVPAFAAEFIPDALFARRADDFMQIGAGVDYVRPLDRALTLVGGADVQQRGYSDLDAFDFRSMDLHGEVLHQLNDRDRIQYQLRHNDYALDHARFRRMQSIVSQWSRNFGQRARIAVSGHGYRIRYLQPDVQSSSSDLLAAGVNGAFMLHERTRTIGVAGMYLGFDNAVSDRADGDRRVSGVSLGLQRAVADRVEAFVNATMVFSDYADENPAFGIRRSDRQRDLSAGLAWDFADGWSLRPQVTHTRNRSNVQLNDYRRTEASVTVRRTWD